MTWLFSKALMEQCANSHYLQVRAEGYLPVTCLDGKPFAQLNVTPTPQPFFRNDKPMDTSKPSLFGLTCAVLTADRGADLLTWYRADFLAKTSASPERERDLTGRAADSGVSLPGSLAKYDPATHSLKTAQGSLFSDLIESSVTLPRSGTMRNGVVYQRENLAHRMSVIGCGYSLPTPTASSMPCEGTVRIMRKNWQEGRFTLEEASAIAGRDVRKAQGKVPEMKFPTPCARDYKGARSDAAMALTGRNQSTNSLPDYLASIGHRGRMNPVFREWLMAWPLGWTGLKPLETAKFQEWRRQHSPN